jgi:hypothetical protein
MVGEIISGLYKDIHKGNLAKFLILQLFFGSFFDRRPLGSNDASFFQSAEQI